MILVAKGLKERDIRWHISPARMYAYLHASHVMDGYEMVWPEERLEAMEAQARAWKRYERYRQANAAGEARAAKD